MHAFLRHDKYQKAHNLTSIILIEAQHALKHYLTLYKSPKPAIDYQSIIELSIIEGEFAGT